MRSKINTAGAVVLVFGVLMLAAGLILGFTVGTFAVPVLVSSSILVNSVGIMLLRYRKSS